MWEFSLLAFLEYFIPVVVQSLGRVQLFVTPRTAACQASLSFTISQNMLKLMSLESVMPSNHLIPCHLTSQCFLASGSFPMVGSLNPVARVLAKAFPSGLPQTLAERLSVWAPGWLWGAQAHLT